MATSSSDSVTQDISENEQNSGRTLWIEQDDPTYTGVDIDHDYVATDSRQESVSDAYNTEAEAVTDDGQPLDARSDAAATDTKTEDTDDLDGNPLESSWAANGVQRTTLYADDKDGYGEELPQVAADGTNLGARRRRMWKYNSGFGWNDHSDTGRVDMEARETREMTEAVASQCGLTDSQKERAVQIALDMDGRRWNWAGGRPAMALGAIARAVAESAEQATAHAAVQSDAFEHVAEKACRADAERLVGFAFESE